MGGTRRIPVLGRGAVALLPLLAGCFLHPDVDEPRWARVVVTASPPFRTELLTSQKFLVTEGSVQLIQADTDTLDVPFDRRYTLGTPARFFARVTNVSTQTVTFSMKVFLEERSWMDEEETLAPGEKTEFVYRYSEPTPNG